MGLLDGLLTFGVGAGLVAYYYAIYDEYDDESLVDEFCRLWKLKHNYDSSDDDEIRLNVVKMVIDKRGLFD